MKIDRLTEEELFYKLLETKSSKIYWKIVQKLRELSTQYVFDRAVELVKSDDLKQKLTGIDILAQLRVRKTLYHKEIIKIFFNLLNKESNLKILNSVLISIGHNNDRLTQKQINTILLFKNHKSSKVRYGVVFALLGVKNGVVIDTLIELSNDKNEVIRDWATFGIGSQIDLDNEKIRAALWQRVDDKDSETKFEAISGLAKRGDLKIKKTIWNELIAGEFGSLIFEAIDYLDGKEFFPLLKECFEKSQKESDINPRWLSDLKNIIDSLEER